MFKKLIAVILAVCLSVIMVPNQALTMEEINQSKTVTGMRMEPLITQYSALTDIDLMDTEKRFSDVSNHWGKPNIVKLAALNIINGYGDGKFGPNDTLLASQYIKMVVMALGFTPENTGSNWWDAYVDIALSEGLIQSGEISDYSRPLTRELAGTIGFRALMKFEAQPTGEDVWYNYNKSKITDYALISDQYKNDVVMAYRLGLLQGNSNNLFLPKGTLTRAEAAVIVNKLIDKSLRVESVPKPEECIHYTSPDFNESFFYDIYPNKEYTFVPGDFPLNEIYNVVKALVEMQPLAKGYVTNLIGEKTKVVSTSYFTNKEAADKFYFEDPAMPTSFGGMDIFTHKTALESSNSGALTNNNTGFLYAINTQQPQLYNELVKDYMHEVLKAIFGDEAEIAIKLHDYYLNLALNGKEGEYETVFINNRQVHISGGTGSIGGAGFRMEIWARGAIQK